MADPPVDLCRLQAAARRALQYLVLALLATPLAVEAQDAGKAALIGSLEYSAPRVGLVTDE